MKDEVDSLLVDKHKCFLQVDNIILGVSSQSCPKYPKQQICNIFSKFQGKVEE